MNLKTNSVAPSCAEARVNVEAGTRGAAGDVVNMRETRNALVAVGMPRELLSLPSGYSLLIADRRGDRLNFLVYNGTNLSLYAYIEDGKLQVCNIPIGSIMYSPVKAVSVGDFVVVNTTKNLVYLHYEGGTKYSILHRLNGVPQLAFSAVELTKTTRLVAPYSFRNGYTSWAVPLDSSDVSAITGRLRETYSAMIEERRTLGQFVQPVALRYAVKMIDGSYLWCSTPVIVGRGVQGIGSTEFHVSTSSSVFSGTDEATVEIESYSLAVSVMWNGRSEWDSLIDCIELYIAEMPSPFLKGDAKYRCDIVTSPSRDYFLNATLPHLDSERLANALANPEKWRLLGTIKNMEALRNNTIEAIGWRRYAVTPNMCPTWCIDSNTIHNDTIDSAAFVPIMEECYYERHPDAIASFDGILYLGGGDKAFVMNNPLHNFMTGIITKAWTCSQTFVWCRTHEGESVAYEVSKSEPASIILSPMIAVHVPGAYKIAFSADIGNKTYYVSFPLTQSRYGYSYYVDSNLNEITLTEVNVEEEDDDILKDKPEEPFPRFRCSNVLTASPLGNPFAVESRRRFGDGNICAVIAPTKPVTANIFGRFPLYAFSSDGVYSVDTEKNSVKSRCIARLGVHDGDCVAAGMDWVYFASGNTIYAVSGSNIKVVARDVDVDALSYVERFGELWSIDHAGNATVWNSSGRYYRRTIASHHFDASGLLVTADNIVADTADEVPADELPIEYTSHPFSLPLAPRIVLWHIHSSRINAVATLHGVDSLCAIDAILNTHVVEGAAERPEKLRLCAPCHTVLKIKLSGTAATGSLLLPTKFWY